MKKAYSVSAYAKGYEKYCDENFPFQKKEICEKAEKIYLELMENQYPDLGGKENPMARNMSDWLTIVSFYEASDHKIDGKALLEIKRKSVESVSFLGKFIDGNKNKWVYKVFRKIYI